MRSFIIRSAASVATVALLLLAGPVRADEKPLARIDRGIKGLQAQIKNASMRLQYVTEPSAAESSSQMKRADDKPTPLFIRCCSKNINVMQDRFREIRHGVRELYDRHGAAGEESALNALSGVAVIVEAVGKNLERLERTGDYTFARSALKTLGASVREMQTRVGEYAECCGPDAGKSRKKSKGRKGDAS